MASILDDIGLEPICQRIENGESQAEIARSLGVSQSTLSAWLNREDNRERSARAREASAESWLDRGLDRLDEACRRDSGMDAAACKAYAQECARRAAIRNPRYVDKTAHQHSGGIKVHSVTDLTDDDLAAAIAGASGG